MAREYTTIEKIQSYLGISDSDYNTTKIEIWIQDMTEYIEERTNRVFEADDIASEKIYEVKKDRTISIELRKANQRMLLVDDFIEGTNKLTIDDVEIDSDDYLFYPLNESPKTKIVLTKDSGIVFTEDEQNIKFEACWGYSESVPKTIDFVCMVLVAGLINNSLSQEGELKSISIGRYNATYKDEKQLKDFDRIEEILDGYTKITL